MGPLTAARLNAEHGCKLDLDRVLAAWFGDGDLRRTPWKITAGTRVGGMTCDGLDCAYWGGKEPGFHAFAMGTLQGPAWLVPVARYDARYARDIGRYALHAASSARLFQGFGLDWDHQDHKDWKDRCDPQCLLSYEAVTSWDWSSERTFRPYATGDPIRLGWGVAKTGAGLLRREAEVVFKHLAQSSPYMGNHVGFLGGIMALTDVPGILRWDCVATDWFHAPAYPTWLFYNPNSEARAFHTDVGPAPADLYDAVQRDFVKRAVRGRVELTVAPNAAAVIVAAPASGKLTRDGNRTLIEGVVVDFGAQRTDLGHLGVQGWVAPGDYSPGAPADPDVRNYPQGSSEKFQGVSYIHPPFLSST